MGIKANRVIAIAFAISGAARRAGRDLHPRAPRDGRAAMGFNPVLKAFIATVIGGLGSLCGAVVGGFVLAFVEVGARRVPAVGARAAARRVHARDRDRDPLLPARRPARTARGGALMPAWLQRIRRAARCCSPSRSLLLALVATAFASPAELRVVVSFLITVSLVARAADVLGQLRHRVVRARRLHGHRRVHRRAARRSRRCSRDARCPICPGP